MEINQLELAEVARAFAVIRLQLLVAILGESQVSPLELLSWANKNGISMRNTIIQFDIIILWASRLEPDLGRF